MDDGALLSTSFVPGKIMISTAKTRTHYKIISKRTRWNVLRTSLTPIVKLTWRLDAGPTVRMDVGTLWVIRISCPILVVLSIRWLGIILVVTVLLLVLLLKPRGHRVAIAVGSHHIIRHTVRADDWELSGVVGGSDRESALIRVVWLDNLMVRVRTRTLVHRNRMRIGNRSGTLCWARGALDRVSCLVRWSRARVGSIGTVTEQTVRSPDIHRDLSQ